MHDYEEYTKGKQLYHWIYIFFLSFGVISFCMITMYFIGDYPSEWNYNNLPDTPSESIYSTKNVEGELNFPKQIEPLPGAETMPAALDTLKKDSVGN